MKKLLTIFSFFSLISLISVSVFGKGSTASLSLIREEYEAGSITLDQKANLYIDAIKAPQKLPSKYLRPLAQSEIQIDCPTAALCEIRASWDQLSPETQQHFSEAFARFSTEFTYVTPSGFFTVHYDTSGTNSIPNADGNSNMIPDYIERVSDYLDSSLDKHTAMGFLLPPSDGGLGDDTTFDVYFEEMGYYGYAVPEGNGPAAWNDYYSHLTLHRNFIGFPPNNDPEGDQLGAAKVTIAHEFHHCVQFAYDAGESVWFMELDATAMEDIVFNATDDNYNYLSDFFSAPQKSLMEQSIHMYACFTWDSYLFQKFDTTLMRAIWEGARFSSVYNTLSDTLMHRYGWSQDSAFGEYAVWNFITNSRNDGLHHEEASAYPLITVGRTHSTFPVTSQNGPSNPAGYAATYVQFFPNAGTIGKLRITVDGDNSRQWKFYAITSTANSVHSVEQIPTASPNYTGTVDIPQFESTYRVALVAVNVSEFSSGGIFTYSATVIPPYQVAASLLTDSSIYSGAIRNYKLKITNPSVLSDIYSVFVSDDLGWLPLDTINVAVGANDDSTISIPVQPPIGTALGLHSTLHFVVRSWGDTTVIDTQTIVAVTKLQRGDDTFNGGINIVDLLYMVSFLFNSGPAPMPVLQAGDFNCDNNVTVIDITAHVRYLFQAGPKPTCNPY